MTEIVLNFNDAQQAADDLKAEVTKINELKELEAGLIDQIAGQWEGMGQSAWEQRQREWQKESAEEAEALARLVEAVMAAIGTMKDTEAKVSEFFK